MFRKSASESAPGSRDIGLLGNDTRFEGTVRFAGTLRVDGVVAGNIVSQPGSGSVLIVNKQAVVTGDIVSDSVLISGRVEGEVRASERVEIFRSGSLTGDIYTSDVMIEAGAAFHGYCHMDGESVPAERIAASPRQTPKSPPPAGEGERSAPAENAAGERRQVRGSG